MRPFIKDNSTHVRLSNDKVQIEFSFAWKAACDAEMAKRTKASSPAEGNAKQEVKQEVVTNSTSSRRDNRRSHGSCVRLFFATTLL